MKWNLKYVLFSLYSILTTDSQDLKMGINTHISLPIGVKNGTEGCIFTPVPCTINGADAEKVYFSPSYEVHKIIV